MRNPCGVFIAGLIIVGCSAVDSVPGTSPPNPEAEQRPTTTDATPITTSTSAVTTTVGVRPDFVWANGAGAGPDVFEFERGETVDLWVDADVSDELHVHGYDIFVRIEPGEPVHVEFVAAVPGIFEVELEGAHIRLFEIEVSG
jgi:hypothetical protein